MMIWWTLLRRLPTMPSHSTSSARIPMFSPASVPSASTITPAIIAESASTGRRMAVLLCAKTGSSPRVPVASEAASSFKTSTPPTRPRAPKRAQNGRRWAIHPQAIWCWARALKQAPSTSSQASCTWAMRQPAWSKWATCPCNGCDLESPALTTVAGEGSSSNSDRQRQLFDPWSPATSRCKASTPRSAANLTTRPRRALTTTLTSN